MFWERFEKLCKENSIKPTTLVKKIAKSSSNTTVWKTKLPKTDKLIEIADYFNVSVDYLLGRVNSPYYVSIDSYDSETYIADIGKLFQQDDIVRRYASRLFEAHNDIYNANALLSDLLNDKSVKPIGCNHVCVIMKYIIIILAQTFKLLQVKGETVKYKEAVAPLTEKAATRNVYNMFISATKDNSSELDIKFIIELRNLIAHYDHEKNDKYPDVINSMRNCELKEERGHLLYREDFLFTQIFPELYRKRYNSKESNEEVFVHIIKICSRVLELTGQCLKEMLDEFLEAYGAIDYIKYVPSKKSKSVANVTKKAQIIKNSNNSISGNNNIIGNGNIVGKHSEQETALIDIFNRLDVVKQAKLLVLADELEKE